MSVNANEIILRCFSIQDLRDNVSELNTTDKGEVFAKLTKLFLQVDPTYSSLLKNVWLEREVPINIRTLLNHPKSDDGIDIICETFGSEFWSVQAKFFQDEDESLGRTKLGTFYDLSFNICKHITHALAVTTANNISRKLKTKIGQSRGFITNSTWEDLTEQDWQLIHRKISGLSLQRTLLKPRKHQEEAIAAGHQHFTINGNNRGKGVLPCGAGKSLLAYWLNNKLDSNLTLVAAPSLLLLKQSINVWMEQFCCEKIKADWIAVCSDESVQQEAEDSIDDTSVEIGLKVTTNPEALAKWLKNNSPHKRRIVFCTYQSGKVVSEAARDANICFDLGIFDEAHKTTGDEDSLFAHLLHDRHISISKRLFLTATERVYKGHKDNYLSMDDREVYGDLFYFLSYKEAIKQSPQFLTDYRILTIDVSSEEIAHVLRHNKIVCLNDMERELQSRVIAAAIAHQKAIENYPITHTISFHSTLQKARAFKLLQSEITTSSVTMNVAECVTGKTSTSDRAKTIRDFASAKHGLLTNARCLTEGVDIPAVNAVMFADPKKSIVDIVQAVGRAMRVNPGKEFGYIIVPIEVYVDKNGNEIPSDSSFKDLWKLIRELSRHDERIIDEVRHYATKGTPYSGPLAELPRALSERIDTHRFISHINVKAWSKFSHLHPRPFEETREHALSLNLTKGDDWKRYWDGTLPDMDECPKDFPRNPEVVYKGMGWQGWADFLGYKNKKNKVWATYEEARDWASSLGLSSGGQWYKYVSGEGFPDLPPRPDNIPVNPSEKYKTTGWTGWRDFLGSTYNPSYKSMMSDDLMPMEEARKFVGKLNLLTAKEWFAYCEGKYETLPKKPADIPNNPAIAYRHKGWRGMDYWLQCPTKLAPDNISGYVTHKEAMEFAKRLELRTPLDWAAMCRGDNRFTVECPRNIPRHPHITYSQHGWRGWEHFLGMEVTRGGNLEPPTFNEARNLARNLGLTTPSEWYTYWVNQNDNHSTTVAIPIDPNIFYRELGWEGWNDFLGIEVPTRVRYRNILDYSEAKKLAHRHSIETISQWTVLYQEGSLEIDFPLTRIPTTPKETYRDSGWEDWNQFWGKPEQKEEASYLPFKEARLFVAKLGLKTELEWKAYCKGEMFGFDEKPSNIPSNPRIVYTGKDEWQGIKHWLGADHYRLKLKDLGIMSLEEATKFARSLNLSSYKEWDEYINGELPDLPPLPEGLPKAPDQTYEHNIYRGWRGWMSFLWRDAPIGWNDRMNKVKWRPFSEAREFVRSLNLKCHAEWVDYCHNGIPGKGFLPEDIPDVPHDIYKNGEWRCWNDWIGVSRKQTDEHPVIENNIVRLEQRTISLETVKLPTYKPLRRLLAAPF